MTEEEINRVMAAAEASNKILYEESKPINELIQEERSRCAAILWRWVTAIAKTADIIPQRR